MMVNFVYLLFTEDVIARLCMITMIKSIFYFIERDREYDKERERENDKERERRAKR